MKKTTDYIPIYIGRPIIGVNGRVQGDRGSASLKPIQGDITRPEHNLAEGARVI